MKRVVYLRCVECHTYRNTTQIRCDFKCAKCVVTRKMKKLQEALKEIKAILKEEDDINK